MINAKFYELKNGKQYIVLASATYENIKYLLLMEETTKENIIAFEENEMLKIINDKYPDYDKINKKLLEKFKKNINNCKNNKEVI